MTRKIIGARRIAVAAALVAAASALTLPATSFAQNVRPDARWQGWLGCWQPVSASSADSYTAWMQQRARDAGAPVLCIVPSATPTSVELVTVAGGKVTARETVDAGTAPRSSERDGCEGSEGATWSQNARRLYLESRYSCAGGVQRASSGMLGMASNGELVDVEEIASGGGKAVHVTRYASVMAPAGITIDSTLVPRADALPVTAARAAMGAALTGEDIVDAVHHADSLVVEAWLIERGDRFSVDAKRLAALADAGVPGRITDLMVALSNPGVSALARPQRVAVVPPAGGSTIYTTLPPADPLGYGYMPGYGSLGYGTLGYSPYLYGNGYGSGYGYGGYGYGGYLYQPPVVIVRNSGGTARPHGRVVNGQGYTRDPSASSGSSSSGRSGSTSSANSGSSSSSGSSGSSSGSSSSGETRHAKPRP